MNNNICPICLKSCLQRFLERRWEYTIYECSNCTVQYSTPLKRRSNDKRDKKIYRRRLELIGHYLGWDHRVFLTFLQQNFKKSCKIFEIGCGTGDFIHLANKNDYNAVGVDLDREAVLTGRDYWKIDSIFPISAEEYFYKNKDKKFDIICLFAVLEHLENPKEILEEIKQYLNTGGYICLSTPNNDSTLNKIWGRVTRVDYPPHHLLRWNKKSIEIFLKLYGFEIVSRKTCKPTITDMITDLYKLYFPSFLRTSVIMRLSGLTCKILAPFDSIVKKFIKEGRSQLIVAKLKG